MEPLTTEIQGRDATNLTSVTVLKTSETIEGEKKIPVSCHTTSFTISPQEQSLAKSFNEQIESDQSLIKFLYDWPQFLTLIGRGIAHPVPGSKNF